MKFEWNLDDFCKDNHDFINQIEMIHNDIASLQKKSSTMELDLLIQDYYDLEFRQEKVSSYAELSADLDMSAQKYASYKEMAAKVKDELSKIKEEIDKKILKYDTLEEIINEYPKLKDFQMSIYEVIRLKKHDINQEMVQSLNNYIPEFNNLYQIIKNVETKYETIKIDGESIIMNAKNYAQYSKNENRAIRKNAFESYFKSNQTNNKSISALLNLRMKTCVEVAKAKGYNSVIEQAIDENDLHLTIIEHLINSVHKNLHQLQRYLNLRKKDLNVDKLYYYDLNYTDEIDVKCTFDEAIKNCKDALCIFGPEYQSYLDKALSMGTIDVFPRQNKFPGGYHWRNYIKPMILMNYQDDYASNRILAHELGHAVNGLMIKDTQSFQNFHFSVFLSEIASKVNEQIFNEYYYKKVNNKKEKKQLLLDKINELITSIFTCTLYLEFEKELYSIIENGGYLTDSTINDMFYTLYHQYFTSIEDSEYIKYMWQERLHYFFGKPENRNHTYYNYQYATGKVASLKISNDILKGKGEALDNYLRFLKIGGSMPTLKSLEEVGVSFDENSIYEECMDYLTELLDEYEKILNEE